LAQAKPNYRVSDSPDSSIARWFLNQKVSPVQPAAANNFSAVLAANPSERTLLQCICSTTIAWS
jgi:hypothetical protein